MTLLCDDSEKKDSCDGREEKEDLNCSCSTSSDEKQEGDDQLESALEDMRERAEQAEERADEYLEQLMRSKAEFQNYKKRINRERQRVKKRIRADVVAEFLPIMDNLKHAVDAPGKDEGPVKQGVSLILKQVDDLLSKMNIERIPTEGHKFDPEIHEALGSVVTEEYPANKVVDELTAGYILKDDDDEILIRPAQVRVAQAPPDRCDDTNEKEESE